MAQMTVQVVTPDGLKYDHLPEDAFRGVGSIEDVIAKAEKMGF